MLKVLPHFCLPLHLADTLISRYFDRVDFTLESSSKRVLESVEWKEVGNLNGKIFGAFQFSPHSEPRHRFLVIIRHSIFLELALR